MAMALAMALVLALALAMAMALAMALAMAMALVLAMAKKKIQPLPQMNMYIRIQQKAKVKKQLTELGHTMSPWVFSQHMPYVECQYCLQCKQYAVLGLPLHEITGTALDNKCSEN